MLVTKMPSMPKELKKYWRLRVRRKGTASLRSSTPRESYSGYTSHCQVRPEFLANRILCGDRPPTTSRWHSTADSAMAWQNCFLNAHSRAGVGSVLYMYCEKMFSATSDRSTSSYA